MPIRFELIVLAILGTTVARAADVSLIDNGKPAVVIVAPARVMDDAKKNPEPDSVWRSFGKEDNRRRLRESIKDCAAILERMGGTKIEIVAGELPVNDKRLPILVGELAEARFGKPQKSYPYQQGFRIVVVKDAIGIVGESDLATSYGLYTLLDQLGCRWYMPSALGEVLPASKTIRLPEQDISTGPTTIYRGMWYADNDFGRRNRMGGMAIEAGHNLEMAVPKELRKTNPEIRAVIQGKPSEHNVKWTHPLVADALVKSCFDYLKQYPERQSYSLSPDDGISWDESDDKKFDAGDFDPSTQMISKTDRLLVLCNRVAEKVSAKHPHLKLGFLAYADYTRPPVREKVHPNLVPQIAPITFSRAHPMNDDGEPNNHVLRYLVEGWGKMVPATSYYFYAYNLAEVSAPNPMIARWGHDIPYIYQKGKCRFWQPETLTNFETSMHAHTLGLRLAWDNALASKTIIDELHEKFYGDAAVPMAAYWRLIDDAWTKTPEYAGCGWGYLRRWPAKTLINARKLLDTAAVACRNDVEKRRVMMASESLGHFELFMKMRRDLAEGRFATLADDVAKYRKTIQDLGAKYKPQFAFGQMGWTAPDTINGRYFAAFYEETYKDAARVASKFDILTQPPLKSWRWQTDKDKKGEAAGWMNPKFDDSAWKTTDPSIDTWSSLGLHNYMGSLWYRTKATLAPAIAGKKTFLWIGSTDGRVKVFVNGKHVPFVDAKGKTEASFVGYCQPASFDITAALAAGENQISLFCTREFLNELGSGGLLAAPVVYREK